MAELATLAVEGQLDARDETVAAAQRQRDRAALDLDHLAVDLRKERQDLIHEHAQGGLGCLGSRRSRAPDRDEDSEGNDTSGVNVHRGACASISPRLAQGVGRVKEWEGK